MPTNLNNWKACLPQKGNGGSNPPHSAHKCRMSEDSAPNDKCIIQSQKVAENGVKTAKKPHSPPMRKVRVSLYYRPTTDKHGTAPLLVAVNHASSSCYIPLMGVRIAPNQWDKLRKKVINHPQADTINSVAASTLGKANEAVMKIMQAGGVRGLSTAQVRDLVASHIYPVEQRDYSVLAVMRDYMEQCRKPNTADKFKQTITHIERFAPKRLQFADITPEWLQSFDRYLISSCPSVNSRSIHLRNIRTVFNYALTHEITTAPYPFRKYKIKSAPATPIALTLEQMRKLWRYQPQNEAHAYALDIWKLSFALIGINMADLCRLFKVSQGRINYTRQKTSRLYSIKVEPSANAIIRAHKGRTYLLDILDRYKDVHIANSMINRHMKEIASALELPSITVYTARYTWASIAMQQDTPIEVISQALGHSYGMAVTLGYIVPDRRKVDEANKKVLELVTT